MSVDQLELINLSHKYDSSASKVSTLKSVNLNINKGELLGLVGPSGCGKTTLLRLIAGFETPSKGQIFISGEQVSSPSFIKPPEKRRVGMVFQDYALFPHMNVWKNVCFGLKQGADTDRPLWLLKLLGLSEYLSRYPHELSGGQKQRLALARALAPDNSLILLDEPFNSLDYQVRLSLRNELASVLRSCEASAVLVTHDSQEALAICDRVAVMSDGLLHQCGTPNQLIESPSSPFVGKFLFQNNTIPININEDKVSTPIGIISISSTQNLSNFTSLMFDVNAIEINYSNKSNFIIKSREYYYDHWIYTVISNQINLRVSQPISSNFINEDNCLVTFKKNQEALLFPGAIKCTIN